MFAMTEKEAWLEIARQMIEGSCGSVGICDAIKSIATVDMWYTMKTRLRMFSPQEGGWYWPVNKRRVTRTLPATACCFLAAMCDD